MELSFLNLLLVLLVAWFAGQVATRFRYPAVLGELVAGIVLGPPLLGLLSADAAIGVLAELGVLLMMLYVGMEIDPREMGKASWAGLLAAVGGFITPFVLGYAAVIWLGYSTAAALFLAIAVAITSLTTKSRFLVDLKILDTRIAHVLMAGALISDSAALITFAAVLGFVTGGTVETGSLLLLGVRVVLFFAVTGFLGLKVMPLLFGRLNRAGLGGRAYSASLIFIIAVLFAELAELAGLHAILGAFIAGLFMGEGMGLGRKVSRQLRDVVHDVSIGFLAPIFFVTAGFQVTFNVFRTDLALFIAIMVIAFVGKILGTALFYLPTGYGWREGLTIGAGMNGRGAVEIIIAGVGLQMGIISVEIFSILVFMAIFTTATVPFGLKWGIAWLKRHDELVRAQDERRGTLIVGAGPVARELARQLSQSQPVRLLDSNPELVAKAQAEGLEASLGDALEDGALEEAGAARVETFLGMTANAQVNLLAAQLARNNSLVPHTYVLMTGSDSTALDTLLEEAEADPLFSEPLEVREWDRWMRRQEVEVAEVEVGDAPRRDLIVRELRRAGDIPLAVARGDRKMLVAGTRTLEPGDRIVVLRRREGVDRTAVESAAG